MNYTILPKPRIKNNRPLTVQIYEYLRRVIVLNLVVPGDSFSENELSAHFKVSRQPIRDAISKLANENLLVIAPQRGTYVNKISIKGLKEVCYLRGVLEGSAIENIANLDKRSFKKILRELEDCLDESKETDFTNNTSLFIELDDKFHEIICKFSQCDIVWKTISNAKGNLDRIRALSFEEVSPIDRVISSHDHLYNLIAQKNINEAKAFIHEHVFEVMETHKPIRIKHEDFFDFSED